jgi:hypothetical protein
MILQSAELPPSQKTATDIKEPMALPAKVATAADRQQAANQMRYQLYLLDRSERRMSIEDCMAAMLERSGTELPA